LLEIFVKNTAAPIKQAENVIAQIAKAVWEHAVANYS
jgi:hypothetical protein